MPQPRGEISQTAASVRLFAWKPPPECGRNHVVMYIPATGGTTRSRGGSEHVQRALPATRARSPFGRATDRVVAQQRRRHRSAVALLLRAPRLVLDRPPPHRLVDPRRLDNFSAARRWSVRSATDEWALRPLLDGIT